MVVACWSPKGGSGTTVVAATLGRLFAEARAEGACIVDLAGDVASALGGAEPRGPGLAEWLAAGDAVPADGLARIELPLAPGLTLVWQGEQPLVHAARAEVLAAVLASDPRTVVIDCGRIDGTGSTGPEAEVRRVLASSADVSLLVVRPCYLALRRAVGVTFRPSGVVVVTEPNRALDTADVEEILQVPVVATVPHAPAIARAVDSGLLGSRLPTVLVKALRGAAA